MADWARYTFFGGTLLYLFAIILLVFSAPAFAETGNERLFGGSLLLAMGFGILGGLLALAGTVMYLYEIATANRDGQWKAIWIILVFLLGVVGVVAYEIAARRSRGWSGGSGNFQEFRRGPGGIELH